VQGESPAGRTSARWSLGILASSHIVAASLTIAILHQLGSLVTLALPQAVILAVVIVAAIVALFLDASAFLGGQHALCIRRQTPKQLWHEAGDNVWVIPVLWGLDTGTIWSTYRVSATSWILLLASLLQVAAPWAGTVYGLAFSIPLVVSTTRRLEPRSMRKENPRRGAQALGMAVLAALPIGWMWHYAP
jgi:hypothetical protein